MFNNLYTFAPPPRVKWTISEEKLFEQGLVVFPEEIPGRWEKIAGLIAGKDPDDVKDHYDELVRDVFDIESGRVQLPSYLDDFDEEEEDEVEEEEGWGPGTRRKEISFAANVKSQNEGRRGKAWTEEEHR